MVDSSDSEQEGRSSAPPEDVEARAKAQLTQTMAGLDALLGIEAEVEPEVEEVGPCRPLCFPATLCGEGLRGRPQSSRRGGWPVLPVPAATGFFTELLLPLCNHTRCRQAVSKAGGVDISISRDVLKAIADAEAARSANARGAADAGASADGSSSDSAQRMKDSLERIAEQARKLAKEDTSASTLGEQAIRSEFENLLSVLAGERGVDPADLK